MKKRVETLNLVKIINVFQTKIYYTQITQKKNVA